jgi:hypothetical protein
MGLTKDTSFKAGDLHWFTPDELTATNRTCPSEVLVELRALQQQVMRGDIKAVVRSSLKVKESREAAAKSDPPKDDD